MRIVSTTLNPVWKVAIPALLMPWDATSGNILNRIVKITEKTVTPMTLNKR